MILNGRNLRKRLKKLTGNVNFLQKKNEVGMQMTDYTFEQVDKNGD